MPYVYSTLTADQNYTNYVETGGDTPIAAPSVFIKGGAGVANDRLITPLGVMTEVTKEQVAYLEANPVFKIHKDNGFIKIEKSKADDADKVAADMARKDGGAPVTPNDYLVKGQDAPTTAGA